MKLDATQVRRIVEAAIGEDRARNDITSALLVRQGSTCSARITAGEACVVCGLSVARMVCTRIDNTVIFKPAASEGDSLMAGALVASIEGNARGILAAERVTLNFLSFMSGIATTTKQYVDAVRTSGVQILDTRKTIPLMRYLQKYAVAVGGGVNHRMHLEGMVLVKDNHFIAGGNCDVAALRKRLKPDMRIEVEVDTLTLFKNVLSQEPDIIMLDNMPLDDIREAVRIRERCGLSRVLLEVSGGITLEGIGAYAKTGIERISIGALTDSVAGIDFSLTMDSPDVQTQK